MTILRFLFCGIILAALAIPGWLTMMKPMTDSQVKNSMTERRRLVRFGQTAEAWPDIKLTVQTFGQAFDDQLFARTEILQTVNGLLVEKAGHSTSDTILLGEDGYRFLMRSQNSKAFSQIPCAVPGGLDEAKRQLTIDNYIAFSNRVQKKGIQTHLVLIPTKSSIYLEKLPRYVHSKCVSTISPAINTIKQLQAAGLSARYDLDWFRTQSATDIFQPGSFHWVKAKSHIYAQFLYDSQQMGIPWNKLPSYETRPIQSNAPADISRHLGIKRKKKVFYEREYFWPTLELTRRHEFKDIKDRSELLAKLNKSIGRFSRNTSPRQKKLLVVGDSFSRGLFAYWASTAGEAIFMSDSNAPYTPGIFDETISLFDADMVVFVIEESKFAPIKSDNPAYQFATKLQPPE